MSKQAVVLVSCIALAGVVSACGKKKDDTAATTTSDLPKIDFSFPSTALALTGDGLPLTAVDGTNVLSNWANRSNLAVKYVNAVLTALGGENLQAKGSITFTNATGSKIAVTLGETSGTYSKTGTICVDGSPSLYIEWNADSTAVHAIRDFNVDAWAQNKTPFTVELTYAKSATGSTLAANSYGTPWSVPTDVAADTVNGGNYLAESVVSARPSDGSFTMKGVNAWETTAHTQTSTAAFTGDAYLTGQLAADGSGNFVAWRRFNQVCASSTFTDSSATSPGWCFAGTVAAAGTVTYALDTSTQWTSSTLAPIGVASSADLRLVTFPAAVVCPAS